MCLTCPCGKPEVDHLDPKIVQMQGPKSPSPTKEAK
jgi:hypothetical protein